MCFFLWRDFGPQAVLAKCSLTNASLENVLVKKKISGAPVAYL